MSTPLRELINRLASDSTSQAAFADDPAGFLDEHGWGDLDGQDVGTALGALADEAPIDQAVRLSDLVDADGMDAVAGLEAAAAALAEVPVNGDSVVELAADPDLALDRQDAPDEDGDPSLGIDHAVDIDDVDDGPDGPDRLDVSNDELDTSVFRAPDDYEGDGQEAPEPTARAESDTDADLADVGPDVPVGDPTAGIDQDAGHESFMHAFDTDGDSDAVVPEPEDDDL
jgi:hypothetical protein